jgi:hypothetical protein
MAVGHIAERTSPELITLGWRPLAAVVPLTDAAALAGAVLVTGRQDRLGLFYAVTAFMILIALGSGRVRINPRLSDDVFHLLGWLSLPLVIAVLLASVDADARLGSLVAIVPLAICLVLLGRAVAYKAIRDARASGLVR